MGGTERPSSLSGCLAGPVRRRKQTAGSWAAGCPTRSGVASQPSPRSVGDEPQSGGPLKRHRSWPGSSAGLRRQWFPGCGSRTSSLLISCGSACARPINEQRLSSAVQGIASTSSIAWRSLFQGMGYQVEQLPPARLPIAARQRAGCCGASSPGHVPVQPPHGQR